MAALLKWIISALLCFTALTYGLWIVENARAGALAGLRRRMGGLALPLAKSMAVGLADLCLLLATYPLGWLPQRRRDAEDAAGGPMVLLVHGLYHNNAAWTVLRRRLEAAGFGHIRAFAYNSFQRDFFEIAEDLAQYAATLAAEHPHRKIVLVGHSLGGLLARAAAANPGLAGRIAGIVALGTPHGGSTLARLALGRLGRSLNPGGPLLGRLASLPVPPGVPRLAVATPSDNMVLPTSNLLPPQGWDMAWVGPMSHVGLLYRLEPARLTLEFLRRRIG